MTDASKLYQKIHGGCQKEQEDKHKDKLLETKKKKEKEIYFQQQRE